MRPRHAAYAVGVIFVGIGLIGLVRHAADTHPADWAVWFGGVVLAHDLVFAPVVLAAGAIATRLPAAVRATLIVGGLVTLVATPVVLGFGRRPDNPSVLPLSYTTNLLIVLFLIGLAGGLTTLRHRRRSGRSGKAIAHRRRH